MSQISKTSFKEGLEVKFAVKKSQLPPVLPDSLLFKQSFSPAFPESLYILTATMSFRMKYTSSYQL